MNPQQRQLQRMQAHLGAGHLLRPQEREPPPRARFDVPTFALAQPLVLERHTFSSYGSASKGGDGEKKTDTPKKSKKRKSDKKSGGDSTSDGSDDGPCWSDYERVPGTKEGEKGSCRPKKKKKKSCSCKGEGSKCDCDD